MAKKMKIMPMIELVAIILILVFAINFGAAGLGYDILGGFIQGTVATVFAVLVGLSGVLVGYQKFVK